MFGEEIVNEIKSDYKIPKQLKVTTDTFIYLHGNPRLKTHVCDGIRFAYFCSIPVVIDDSLDEEYKLIY